jgi:hypothetical protein
MTSRRTFLSLSVAAAALPGIVAHAGTDPRDITWRDLVPQRDGSTMDRLRQLGVVQHGELDTPFEQETAAQITTEFNGERVRIPGYVVPLEFTGTGVSTFLLVPYVGACIHVPPPPPNQLIFVTSQTPYEIGGLFEPVSVTGLFDTAATETMLAEVGYTMVAERIEPYG